VATDSTGSRITPLATTQQVNPGVSGADDTGTPGTPPNAIDNGLIDFTAPALTSSDVGTIGNINPTTGAVGTSGNTTGTSGNSGKSTLGNLLSGVTSALGSSAGTTAEYAGLAALGESEAASQQSTLNSNAAQLASLGVPQYTAGVSQLGTVGAAAPAVNTGLIDNAGTELGIAAQNLNAYQTGRLTPSQQAALDQQTQQQKQAIAQQFASQGATGSAAEASALQQVDNNALAQKQTYLNSDFSTAQSAQSQAQTTFGTILSQSLSEITAGVQPIESAIQTLITGDAQIAQSLEQFFGALGEGYGKAVGGGTTSSSPAKSSGSSGSGGGSGSGNSGGGSKGSGSGGGGGDGSGTTDDATGTPGTPPNAIDNGLIDFGTGSIEIPDMPYFDFGTDP
jgi:hypothetical protein